MWYIYIDGAYVWMVDTEDEAKDWCLNYKGKLKPYYKHKSEHKPCILASASELKFTSDKIVTVLQKLDVRSGFINVYFKSKNGTPVRTRTKRGNGLDILRIVANDNDLEPIDIVEKFHPTTVYRHYVSIPWYAEPTRACS